MTTLPAAATGAARGARFSAGSVLLGSCWAVLLVGLLVAGAVRLLTLHVNILNVDEAAYAAEAVRALDTGSIVLKASRDNKPPGIVTAYAAVFEVFGRYNMTAVRTAALVCVTLTCALLFVFCRRWLSTAAGAGAAGFYGLATSLDLRFIAFKTELLMNLPLCAAICLSIDVFVRTEQTASRRRLQLLLSGGCVALAIATRQPAAFIFVGVWAGLLAASLRKNALGQLAIDAACCAAGAMLGLAVIAALYVRADAWPELWRQAIEFPRDFATTQRYGIAQRAMRFATYLEEYFRYAQILFGLALYGLVAALLKPAADSGRSSRRPLPMAAAGGLAASVFAFALAPDMYQAYFLQLFLPLALAFALGLQGLLTAADGREARGLAALLLIVAVASAAVSALKDPVKYALGQTRLGQQHPLDDLLRAKAGPRDTLYVWGFRPQFYLNSGLAPATRFTLTDLVVGLHGDIGKGRDPQAAHPYYEPEGWNHFMAELAQERPRFIVDALYMANIEGVQPLTSYPALRDHVSRHYQVVATTPDHITLYERIAPQP